MSILSFINISYPELAPPATPQLVLLIPLLTPRLPIFHVLLLPQQHSLLLPLSCQCPLRLHVSFLQLSFFLPLLPYRILDALSLGVFSQLAYTLGFFVRLEPCHW